MGSSLSALIFSVKQEGSFSAEREGVGKWQLEGKRRVHGVASQKYPSKTAILITRNWGSVTLHGKRDSAAVMQ